MNRPRPSQSCDNSSNNNTNNNSHGMVRQSSCMMDLAHRFLFNLLALAIVQAAACLLLVGEWWLRRCVNPLLRYYYYHIIITTSSSQAPKPKQQTTWTATTPPRSTSYSKSSSIPTNANATDSLQSPPQSRQPPQPTKQRHPPKTSKTLLSAYMTVTHSLRASPQPLTVQHVVLRPARRNSRSGNRGSAKPTNTRRVLFGAVLLACGGGMAVIWRRRKQPSPLIHCSSSPRRNKFWPWRRPEHGGDSLARSASTWHQWLWQQPPLAALFSSCPYDNDNHHHHQGTTTTTKNPLVVWSNSPLHPAVRSTVFTWPLVLGNGIHHMDNNKNNNDHHPIASTTRWHAALRETFGWASWINDTTHSLLLDGWHQSPDKGDDNHHNNNATNEDPGLPESWVWLESWLWFADWSSSPSS